MKGTQINSKQANLVIGNYFLGSKHSSTGSHAKKYKTIYTALHFLIIVFFICLPMLRFWRGESRRTCWCCSDSLLRSCLSCCTCSSSWDSSWFPSASPYPPAFLLFDTLKGEKKIHNRGIPVVQCTVNWHLHLETQKIEFENSSINVFNLGYTNNYGYGTQWGNNWCLQLKRDTYFCDARTADQHNFNADSDPSFHFNADPDPAILQTLQGYILSFHTSIVSAHGPPRLFI